MKFAASVAGTLAINAGYAVMIAIMKEQHEQKWKDFEKELIKQIQLQEDYYQDLLEVCFPNHNSYPALLRFSS